MIQATLMIVPDVGFEIAWINARILMMEYLSPPEGLAILSRWSFIRIGSVHNRWLLGGTIIIQITRATYKLVKNEFVCEPHGTMNVKGKGEMEVWFVTGDSHD